MNITKMSLVAALLVGSSAFAIENVKVSGDAKLFYATEQGGISATGTSSDLFNKDASAAQAAASLSVSADLTEGVSAGSKMTALSTLGLEGELVNNVWEATNGTSDSLLVNELWLAATAGATTVKMGRMELDTPLVFSEKWSIVANTYDAAVVINSDIPDTTLVGAFVGSSNIASANGYGGVIASKDATTDSTFSPFGVSGAYAFGAVNNSFKPLTVQAWYYSVTHVADAYWVSGDLNMDGILLGLQYTGLIMNDSNAENGSAFALMAGYEMKDMFTAKVAFSGVSEKTGMIGNVGGTQSKLYTEAWWNYGRITQADTTAINVTVEAPSVMDLADLGFYATIANASTDKVNDLMEITVTAGNSYGPLDVALAAIYTDSTVAATSNTTGALQAYLTYNF